MHNLCTFIMSDATASLTALNIGNNCFHGRAQHHSRFANKHHATTMLSFYPASTAPGAAASLVGQHAHRAPASQQPGAARLQPRPPRPEYLVGHAAAAPAHVKCVLRQHVLDSLHEAQD